MAKLNLSSQDVRAEIIELRDELILNLRFVQRAIRQDRESLERYFAFHGDLRYRPITKRDNDNNPTEYGTPTEIVLEPLAAQFRTTVKTLLDSLRLIESEILPEDNPEGRDAGTGDDASSVKRAALRASFKADKGEASLPEPVDNEEVVRMPKPAQGSESGPNLAKEKPIKRPLPRPPLAQSQTELVQNENPAHINQERPATPQPDPGPSKPIPRPWRDTTPRNAESSKNEIIVDQNKTSPIPAKAIGMSASLRAQIASSGGSRMNAMREKYGKSRNENDDEK